MANGPFRALPVLSAGDVDRFYSYVSTEPGHGPNGDCHIWTGGKNKGGYGWFWLKTDNFCAHRIAFVLAGNSDPGDMLVCHACDYRRCCNPEHLHLGTYASNLQEMSERGRSRKGLPKIGEAPRGSKNPNAKFTEEEVLAIKHQLANGAKYRALAREYCVRPQAISHMGRGITWRHVQL